MDAPPLKHQPGLAATAFSGDHSERQDTSNGMALKQLK
jgi:hypothetical protein